MRFIHLLSALLIALAGAPGISAAPAAQGPSRSSAVDSNAIHTMYLDGEFDRATGILEKALAERRVTTHAESVFTFKHLGVMYAADNNSREKGKYYMLQLVTLEPTARIMDMYASDMIYMIFKNIQEEYEVTKGKLQRAQGYVAANQGQAAPPPGPAGPAAPIEPAAKPSRFKRNLLLVGGATAVLVGTGIAAHYVLAEEPATEKVRYDLPK